MQDLLIYLGGTQNFGLLAIIARCDCTLTKCGYCDTLVHHISGIVICIYFQCSSHENLESRNSQRLSSLTLPLVDVIGADVGD